MNELVSIIVPVYNVEKYIKKCIESLLEQTYKNIEIILIDDGSTDSSYEICKEYSKKNKNIKLFHQENKGVSKTRNNGILYSTGNYIIFVDADDYIDNEFVEKIVDDEYDLNICLNNFNYKCNINYVKKDILNTCLSEKYHKLFLGPVCKLYKSDIIKKNKIWFPENMNFGEDTYFNVHYLKYSESVRIINYIGYHINKTNDSLSRKYIPNVYNQMLTLYNYINSIHKINNNIKQFWQIRCIKQIIINDGRTSYKNFKKDMEKLNSEITYYDYKNQSKKNRTVMILIKQKKYRILFLISKYINKKNI